MPRPRQVRNFTFPSDGITLRGLATIPDLDGNGKPEVVVLEQRKSDNLVRARVYDAATGRLIRSIMF